MKNTYLSPQTHILSVATTKIISTSLGVNSNSDKALESGDILVKDGDGASWSNEW
ncbi:MAG: hypothetical protein K6F94_07910 [Bacteroidaceae bacterium]|nr:hypothetical protein [Bacteroidaceae bacterium]